MNPINWMFSKRTQMTLDALAILAVHRAASEAPMHSRDIFSEGGIPPRYLEPSLQQLVKAGILDGVRGPKGGYRLSNHWEKVSLAEVLEALTGLDEDVPTLGSRRPGVRSLFDRLGQRWYQELVDIPLAELIREG